MRNTQGLPYVSNPSRRLAGQIARGRVAVLIKELAELMTCSDFLERYSDFRDDLVSAEDCESLETHLESCPACRRYCHVLSEGVAVARDLPAQKPRADFEARLRHSIYTLDDEERRRRFRPHAPNGGGAMTVVAAAAIIAALAWTPSLFDVTPSVELPEIVVHAPGAQESVTARSLRGRTLAGTEGPAVTRERAPSYSSDLWTGSHSLLFEHTPLYRAGNASFAGTGIQ